MSGSSHSLKQTSLWCRKKKRLNRSWIGVLRFAAQQSLAVWISFGSLTLVWCIMKAAPKPWLDCLFLISLKKHLMAKSDVHQRGPVSNADLVPQDGKCMDQVFARQPKGTAANRACCASERLHQPAVPKDTFCIWMHCRGSENGLGGSKRSCHVRVKKFTHWGVCAGAWVSAAKSCFKTKDSYPHVRAGHSPTTDVISISWAVSLKIFWGCWKACKNLNPNYEMETSENMLSLLASNNSDKNEQTNNQ